MSKTTALSKPAKPTKAAKQEPAAPDRATILKAAQASLEKHSAALVKHIAAFDKATLANKLGLGLACLKAHMAFAMVDPAKRGQGKKAANQLTREEISTDGFSGWLVSTETRLKEPLAYKYMTAVRGLGLDHNATDRDIATELKRRERKGEAVNLAALIDAATEAVKPPALPPAPPEQLTLDDYVATLKTFRADADAVIEAAKDMPENLRKVACARAYATLRALTGTAWQPADEDDELGTIDPDNITL